MTNVYLLDSSTLISVTQTSSIMTLAVTSVMAVLRRLPMALQ